MEYRKWETVDIWDDRWIPIPNSFKVVSLRGLHPGLEMVSSLLDMKRRDWDATKVSDRPKTN